MIAAFGPSKSRMRERFSRMPFLFSFTFSTVSMLRSALLPEGSPMRPVAPPTRAITLCPASWRRRSIMMETRFPAWSEAAEGSKPQ